MYTKYSVYDRHFNSLEDLAWERRDSLRQIVCFWGTRSRSMPIRLACQEPATLKTPQFLRDKKAPEGRRFITFSSTPFCASRRPKSLSKILLGYSKSLQAMVPTFLTRAQFPKHPLWSFVGLFLGAQLWALLSKGLGYQVTRTSLTGLRAFYDLLSGLEHS